MNEILIKKRILKLEISTFKSLSHFLSLYVEFSNFYIKNYKLKRRKIFFLLCGFVTCLKQIWKNFRLPIMKVWYFPYKIVFF